MQVNYIIENWTKEESYTKLCQAIVENGDHLTMLKDYKKSDWVDWKNKPVVFNGSIQMTKIMRDTLIACKPVAWMTSKNYLCSTYYSRFGELLFNDRYAMMSLAELVRNKFLYYGVFGKEANMFVRPDSGDKTFQAQLVDMKDIDDFHRQNKDIEHEMVLVSSPKNIRGEYRFVVSKNGIVAHSTYRYQGLVTCIPSVPKGAREMCEKVLAKGWLPDDVCCVDICDDTDGTFWLLEINSFSSAGLYACDMKAVVKAVSALAVESFLLDQTPIIT